MKAAAVVAVAVSVFLVATPAVSAAPTSQIQQARAYINKHGRDARVLQANVLLVQLRVSVLQESPTHANVNKLAMQAQTAHDNIDNIRNNFAETGSGRFGDAQLYVFMGANELKNSMGALVAYAGNPNAATLAHFNAQYQKGRSEWNQGVKTIWRMAHKTKPPTV